MVWLTGGMFAIACSMIFALLALILFKGLATHWQRAFCIYPLLNGEFEAGELQYRQPFNITRQSLELLDEKSRAKAEQILDGKGQIDSVQLYLRTGNYDVNNRHFAFVPEVTVNIRAEDFQSNNAYKPGDIWLLERREWGVLYGFPCRLEQTYAPELESEYASFKVLVDNLDPLLRLIGKSNENSAPGFELKTVLNESLEKISEELRAKWERSLIGGKASNETMNTTVDPDSIDKAVKESHRKQSQLIAQIETAKQRLGRLDRQLSNSRIFVRKAEIRDATDLQSVADDATQTSIASSNSYAMWLDVMKSIQGWRVRLAGQAEPCKKLDELELTAKDRLNEEQAEFEKTKADIHARLQGLPAGSRLAIEQAMEVADSVSRVQYGLNLEIARLEVGLKSELVTLQVPAVDWLGEVPLQRESISSSDSRFPNVAKADGIGRELAELIGLQEGSDAQPNALFRTELSQSQSFIALDTPQGRRRFWLVDDVDKRATRVAMLRDKSVLISDMVRLVQPNQLGWLGKLQLYAVRWLEFLFGQPREGGIEGGFFPAIWGTIVMTLIMSIAVMPFGVIAALYMREYAKSGWVLSIIRISINNLAGVPSIVYGVFGLSFFCYTIGGYIDGGPIKAGFTPWPSSVWFVALASTTLLGTVAFFLATIGSGSPAQMSRIRKRAASFGGLFWLLSLIGIICLLVKSPFFDGFFQASLPNPTFGKGCLLWASCTLALLTLPVVIVATEEALSAVPNSIREGSYACGAGKWQTLQRIVLPYARPGIITGFILAMARGAGEVAPMMLVGAIPLVTELPLDFEFPFFHGSRSFMHLGFQIYSLGFQSQNSEAAKPMVFTATLLLLTIVTLLNVTAIWLRARLRKRFQGSQF